MHAGVIPLAQAAQHAAQVGGKAANLGRLLARGAPVPPGFAVPVAELTALCTADAGARSRLLDAGDELGYPVAVRSSASIEDTDSSRAPGLFRSIVGVRGRAELESALRAVFQSASTPAAAAYARRAGTAPVQMATVVQRYIEPIAAGVAYSRMPDASDREVTVVEVGQGAVRWAHLDRNSGTVLDAAPALPITPSDLTRIWELARLAEEAIGSSTGADIEWVIDDAGRLWIVQARPLLASTSTQTVASIDAAVADAIAFSSSDPDTVWKLDITHNPDPLSPAQEGLIDAIAKVSPIEMRVVAGYLYCAAGSPPPPPVAPESADALRAFFTGDALPRIEAILSEVEGQDEPDPQQAVSAFVRVCAIYFGELTPALEHAARIASARGSTRAEHAFGRWLRAAARNELSSQELCSRIGAASPAWDVSVPTYRERPELIDRAVAHFRGVDAGPTAVADELMAAVEEIADLDDLLFFRAQAAVRRALLAAAARWNLDDPDDIFFVPLPTVVDAARAGSPPDPGQVRQQARAGRRLQTERRALNAPAAFAAGRPLDPVAAGASDVWRGRGVGGSAEGVVSRIDYLGDDAERTAAGTVLVTRAVTPASLVTTTGAIAVVCESGGLLGHAAAMARELGIPCVVGCRGAWRELRDGDRVLVDGSTGLVIRLPAATH